MPEEYPFHPYRQPRSVTVNIDVTTTNRSKEYTEAILSAIETQSPFILYFDTKDFLIALTSLKTVICFAGGVSSTVERMETVGAFIDRVKLGMVVYDKFSTVDDFYRDLPAIQDVYLLTSKK